MNLLRGLWRLTWLEVKIFIREPLGAFGTIGIPVLMYVLLTRMLGRGSVSNPSAVAGFMQAGLPVFISVMISVNAVLSLVTIVSIYREGGILKRLRATPIRPATILIAHVLVKLLLTALTMIALYLAGRRFAGTTAGVPVLSFAIALIISTWSILSIGFVIASIVPTARFAQPVGALVLYPMVGISGLFFPVEGLPRVLQVVASLSPLTYMVSLLQGIWVGEAWSAHLGDVGALVLAFAVCTALSAKVFRWE